LRSLQQFSNLVSRKIDDETVSDDQMKQDVIRVKRDDADVLGTAVYEVRTYGGVRGLR
jgi:hypothetical protein